MSSADDDTRGMKLLVQVRHVVGATPYPSITVRVTDSDSSPRLSGLNLEQLKHDRIALHYRGVSIYTEAGTVRGIVLEVLSDTYQVGVETLYGIFGRESLSNQSTQRYTISIGPDVIERINVMLAAIDPSDFERL